MRVWILTGNEENWETAFNNGNIWGVREGGLVSRWKKLERGDYLLFYAKSPIKGLIGLGKLESKFKQDKPLWPDEIRAKSVIYPYRFDFQILGVLSPEKWQESAVAVNDLSLSLQAGVNPVSKEEVVKELMARLSDKLNLTINAVKLEIPIKTVTPELSLHNQIRDKLTEIGQMEHFISEKEYGIDSERLDVAWRRVPRGVPTKVFEVQIGGSPHQALSKLKHAFDLWNSEPFIVVDSVNFEKVSELLSGTFHELRPFIKIVRIEQVEEFFKYLIQESSLKEKFGLG